MKLFIDTANLKEIKEAVSWGIIEGVTTNPSLVAKEKGLSFEKIIKEICQIVDGPISAEVLSLKSEEMVKEARKLAAIHKNVTVKIPMTEEGIKAVVALKRENIKTNVTLVFSAAQALLAAKAGATFLSPFLGRIDDTGYDSSLVLEEILTIIKNYQFKTEVIAASVRHLNHVKMATLLGCPIATIPFAVLKQMFSHPKTDEGIKKFLEDWKKVGSK